MKGTVQQKTISMLITTCVLTHTWWRNWHDFRL